MNENVSTLHNGFSRPLCIDFDLHTDGDAHFKKELIGLMINDIWELHDARNSCGEVFHKICHKVKATLEILNDKDLNQVIEQLRNPHTEPVQQEATIGLFSNLCEALVRSLQREAA